MKYPTISYKGDSMIISEIIEYLTELMDEKGDVPLSMDIRENESALAFDDDIGCVFGDYDFKEATDDN